MLPTAADSVGSPTGSVGEPTSADPVVVPIRPMQFRELLDLPCALIQARIKTLAALLGVAVAVASALAVAGAVLAALASHDSDSGTFWGALLVTLVCAWAVRLFVRGVTVPIGLSVVHRQRLDWRGALRRMTSVAGPLLAYQVMYTLIGVGVLTLGAPLMVTVPFAVIWLAWLRGRRATLLPVVFDADARYGDAARRAKVLASGTEWQLVGLWLYLRGLLLVLLVPVLALPQFIADFSGTHRWTVTVLVITAALLMVALGELVESATQVVTYVDRRCRREAWDIPVPTGGGR
ncbi:hypothetical protein [Nocardia seriolae]|uniref:Membrane protein n=1 Tax=Nocardia seriolae TaxID=37332 RepID=A0ABC9YLV7_9NOCA|nr:hypothetical protein [Nocardia seriolae]APA94748.1 hypothetical protein NS506_00669 [Nocardia seriolae]PSK32472.1 hypothetical protein C6575_05200 [Nocardia seriolae]QOW32233.1 hypothetical protein IMZ23_30245 [Nocardia seriolae]QUN19843.1 hypothetical protein KEC46_11320 [Nocardia seriolae]WNJ59323.1 hypothetical protein RMO66_00195 [Nocardia seriolae]